MPRSTPSAADEALIHALAAEDLHVSPAQLERWRHHGLLPRARIVRDRFGGSRVNPHRAETFEACRVLAQVSTRGRPWQYAACVLFEDGLILSTPAVRAAARWNLDQVLRYMRRAWLRAETGAEGSPDSADWVEAVALDAAEFLGPHIRRLIQEEVQFAHPNLGQRRLRPLVDKAVAWRIADLCVPHHLDDEQRQLARTGSREPLDHVEGLVLPLPSERATCTETLTWAEMRVARQCLIARRSPDLDMQGAIGASTWWVTRARLYKSLDHPEVPLTDRDLQIELQALDDLDDQPEGQEPLPGMETVI